MKCTKLLPSTTTTPTTTTVATHCSSTLVGWPTSQQATATTRNLDVCENVCNSGRLV